MFSRGRLQSVTHKRRKRRRRQIQAVVLGSFFLIVVGSVIFVAHFKSIRIQVITSQGNSIISDQEVERVVRDETSGSYYLLFPKDNIFYFPEKRIENRFLTDYPEVISVKIKRDSLKSIIVTFVERRGNAVWCGEDSDCLVLDSSALAFQKATSTNDSYLIFRSSSTTPALRASPIAPEEFTSILGFLSDLNRENIHVTEVRLMAGGVREGLLNAGGKLIWNADQNLLSVKQNLDLLLASPKFTGKNKDGTLNIEYIDLETDNKVFYK